ncbi:hypothetical protein MKX03_010470 [Papaver bracteatum]|nr:hypothetical protein MKX03_010470 [Papaver bracteatum]
MAAAKISFFLGCIIASILLQSTSLDAQSKVCTGYEGYEPWIGSCAGTALYTEYQQYAYQHDKLKTKTILFSKLLKISNTTWCLRTVFTTDNRIHCGEIIYEEETGKHVCTCYTECGDNLRSNQSQI